MIGRCATLKCDYFGGGTVLGYSATHRISMHRQPKCLVSRNNSTNRPELQAALEEGTVDFLGIMAVNVPPPR